MWVLGFGFALVGGFGLTCCYGVVGYVVALITLGFCWFVMVGVAWVCCLGGLVGTVVVLIFINSVGVIFVCRQLFGWL